MTDIEESLINLGILKPDWRKIKEEREKPKLNIVKKEKENNNEWLFGWFKIRN